MSENLLPPTVGVLAGGGCGCGLSERRGNWVRLTWYYVDPGCIESGQALYVDAGNRTCSVNNGFRSDGSFAEWVNVWYLSSVSLAERMLEREAKDTDSLAAVLRNSDDFHRHKAAFIKATRSLLASGRCTEKDFKELPWSKSEVNYKHQPVYFAYCGGLHRSNRLFLNVETGQVFR